MELVLEASILYQNYNNEDFINIIVNIKIYIDIEFVSIANFSCTF